MPVVSTISRHFFHHISLIFPDESCLFVSGLGGVVIRACQQVDFVHVIGGLQVFLQEGQHLRSNPTPAMHLVHVHFRHFSHRCFVTEGMMYLRAAEGDDAVIHFRYDDHFSGMRKAAANILGGDVEHLIEGGIQQNEVSCVGRAGKADIQHGDRSFRGGNIIAQMLRFVICRGIMTDGFND